MSFTTSMGSYGPYPAVPAGGGSVEPAMGSDPVTYQDILAVHDYQGTNQAGLYRRSDFGWDLFDPQPSWRTNAQAQAVWGYGNVVVVHDSISDNRFIHYDGNAWYNISGARAGVWICEAIGGFTPNELWAGGQGYLDSYDGSSWTQVLGYLATLDPVYGIFVKRHRAHTEVWVVGGSAGNEGVYHYDGSSWSNVYSDIVAVDADIGVPTAVWGSYLDDEIWIAFDLCDNPTVSGRVARFFDSNWSIVGGSLSEGQQAIWGLGTDPDRLWAAGDDSAGASPIVIGWDGISWSNKLTAQYVARRMLGLQAGVAAGVYLATGTGASSNGKIYRRWDNPDGEHIWLNDQAPLRQWRDLAVLEIPPVAYFCSVRIEEGQGTGFVTVYDGYFYEPYESSSLVFNDVDGHDGYDCVIRKSTDLVLGTITVDTAIDGYEGPINVEPEPNSYDLPRDSVIRFRIRK